MTLLIAVARYVYGSASVTSIVYRRSTGAARHQSVTDVRSRPARRPAAA